MFKYQLQWAIRSEFGVSWPDDKTSPWDLTFDKLVDWIEQTIDQESKNDPDESELRERIFEEIKSGVSEAIPGNGEDITHEQRFDDLIPWYRRAKARNAIIDSLDQRYAPFFQREPAIWEVVVVFLFTGLVGAILVDSFKNSPLLPFMFFLILVVYIFSILLLDRLITRHLGRFPFETIGEAVEKFFSIEMIQSHAHAKYRGNRNAIQEQLEGMLVEIYVKSQKLFLQTKLGMNFAIPARKDK